MLTHQIWMLSLFVSVSRTWISTDNSTHFYLLPDFGDMNKCVTAPKRVLNNTNGTSAHVNYHPLRTIMCQ